MVVEGDARDGSVPRWVYWNKIDTEEQWNWLGELCFYARRQPVMESTKELGGPKTEEIVDEIPDSVDGVEERNLNLADTTREPKLTIAEWGKLNTCERPCAKEEWRGMTRKTKWKTSKNLGFSLRGEKGGEARRSERRGEDSGIEGRDTRQSTATECEADAKAAFDAGQRSKRTA